MSAAMATDRADPGTLLRERVEVVLRLTELNSRALRAEGRQAGLEVHAARLTRDDGRDADAHVALQAVHVALADEAVSRAATEAERARLGDRLRAIDAALAATRGSVA